MRKIVISGLVFFAAVQANAHDMSTHNIQADSGKLNISYGYSAMSMTSDDTMEILNKGYMMAPVKMSSQAHNIGLGYKQFNISVPYITNSMTHEDMMMREKTKSKGIGDVKLSGKHALDNNFDVYYGLSLPTGSTNKRQNGEVLDYMMQTGSGTVDPSIGVGYGQKLGNWDFGIGADAVIRFYDNSDDYHLGNEYALRASAVNNLDDDVAAYAKIDVRKWDKIRGEHKALDPMMSSTNDTQNSGGERVDGTIGLSFAAPLGAPENIRLSTEFGIPLYQNLKGVQLETDYHFLMKLGGDL